MQQSGLTYLPDLLNISHHAPSTLHSPACSLVAPVPSPLPGIETFSTGGGRADGSYLSPLLAWSPPPDPGPPPAILQTLTPVRPELLTGRLTSSSSPPLLHLKAEVGEAGPLVRLAQLPALPPTPGPASKPGTLLNQYRNEDHRQTKNNNKK